MDGRDLGVHSADACVDAGVHISYVNKAKQIVPQLRIVRIAVSHYGHVECFDAILWYCIGPVKPPYILVL
jgi:hypothetical protein